VSQKNGAGRLGATVWALRTFGRRRLGPGRLGAASWKNWPYLGNGERYGQGYYQSLIGSGIRRVRLNKNH